MAIDSERRSALRQPTPELRAWISRPVNTPAVVRNLSASGAAIESILPLRRGARLTLALLHRGDRLATWEAIVVRIAGSIAAVHFLRARSRPES